MELSKDTGMLLCRFAPVLAGHKCGSIAFLEKTNARTQASVFQTLLGDHFALHLRLFPQPNGRIGFYLFSPALLADRLMQEETVLFLSQWDYPQELLPALTHLAQRFMESPCPHEMGIFLGYPLEDVKGFLRWNGAFPLCCGPWKVYAHPKQAQKTFLQYRRDQELIRRSLLKNSSLSTLLPPAYNKIKAKKEGATDAKDWYSQ